LRHEYVVPLKFAKPQVSCGTDDLKRGTAPAWRAYVTSGDSVSTTLSRYSHEPYAVAWPARSYVSLIANGMPWM